MTSQAELHNEEKQADPGGSEETTQHIGFRNYFIQGY